MQGWADKRSIFEEETQVQLPGDLYNFAEAQIRFCVMRRWADNKKYW